MAKIRPGSFVKPSKYAGGVNDWLPQHAVKALERGSLIASCRLDNVEDDIRLAFCLGEDDDPETPAEFDGFESDVRHSLMNHNMIIYSPEDETVWICWDAQTDEYFIIPEKMITATAKTPKLFGDDRQSLSPSLDLGEADHLCDEMDWYYV